MASLVPEKWFFCGDGDSAALVDCAIYLHTPFVLRQIHQRWATLGYILEGGYKQTLVLELLEVATGSRHHLPEFNPHVAAILAVRC